MMVKNFRSVRLSYSQLDMHPTVSRFSEIKVLRGSPEDRAYSVIGKRTYHGHGFCIPGLAQAREGPQGSV